MPQAIKSLPRSLSAKPLSTALSAVVWCGRSCLRGLIVGAAAFGLNCAQSRTLFSSAKRSIFETGTFWPTSASSACSLQWLVVATMSRWVKGAFPEAVKKLSMSAFWSL